MPNSDVLLIWLWMKFLGHQSFFYLAKILFLFVIH